MPKPRLKEPYHTLEKEMVETMVAGHRGWRPDLPGPESHSDWEAVARALMEMFEVRRRPLHLELPTED